MKLYMPTKVFLERDCVLKHSEELITLGKHAMIVTGKHSSRVNGALADVEQALKDTGKKYCIFDEIEENPSVETVVRAAKIAVDEGVDFFVAIGGGSPMMHPKQSHFLRQIRKAWNVRRSGFICRFLRTVIRLQRCRLLPAPDRK